MTSVTGSPSRDRGDHLEAVRRGDAGVLPAALPVDEDVDVRADPPALVEDPAAHGRMSLLQLAQHVGDGVTVVLVFGAISGELLELSSEADGRHLTNLDCARGRNSSV